MGLLFFPERRESRQKAMQAQQDIHPAAVVEEGGRLGHDVKVGPFAYIASGTEIGDGCIIGPHVVILEGSFIGEECKIHAGAVIGGIPQDVTFRGAESAVRIGRKCVIRECATVNRGCKPGSVTEVGDECLLMACSHVAHDAKLGRGVILANNALAAGYVQIHDRAFISGNVAIHQFTRIGKVAMLGGNCAVSRDVPPFCTVRPGGINRVLGLNVVGLRRAGYSAAEREQIKKAFDILYRSNLTPKEAVEALRKEFSHGPALELAEFVEESERGICPLAKEQPGRAPESF